MKEQFKNLSKQKKLIVGAIAILLFPITFILIFSELTINGFKENRIGKIIGGVFLILLVFGIFTPTDNKESIAELENKERELTKIKLELDEANKELISKDETIEEAKSYLDLSYEEKNKVSEFINQMKNPQISQNTNNESEEKSETQVSDTNKNSNNKSEEVKNDTVVSSSNNNYTNSGSSNGNSKSSNESSKNNVNSSSTTESTSNELVVYANGGSSKSNKYHSSPTAHNMEGAIKMSKSEAVSKGYVACKRCY